MSKLPSHLIIGDPHAHPEHDNLRFKALGRFIAERRPDKIICIGDFADMPSLSSYDKGKLSYEGRRYSKDIAAAQDAMEKLENQIAKARGYKPEKHLTLGNHENRIVRAVQDDPMLEGKVGLGDLSYEKFGWKVHEFLKPAVLDSIAYAHYFAGGVAGRPISGESVGRSLCIKLHASAVQGHSHLLDHSERTVVTGSKMFGLSVGCFTHPGMVEGWNVATHGMWWRGVVLLEEVDGRGYYDAMYQITQRKLMRDFL